MASSLEGNKIIAAVLTAGIIASASGVLSRILYAPHMLAENVFQVDMAAIEAAGGGAAEAPAVEPIAVRLAAADPAKGEAAVKACTSCHSFDKGGANKVGPNLYGVLGEAVGEGAGGYAFSVALTGKGGQWDYDKLDAFLTSPKAWAPGTKMSFAGISNPATRADVIAYLRGLSDNPAPLPEAPAEGDKPAEGEKPADAPAKQGAVAPVDGRPPS